MAMLAEPRRKQKFGSDPRNTFWSNDDSKFGQRMLERMGWSKGKGLGANESGRTEHIKTVARQRDDTRGVGCSKKHADNWLAHQDDFNSLLESLNEGQTTTTTTVSTQDTNAAVVVSLEKKSKSSRSRVHYHKFTRGKDLSSRSAHDLDCIFGKRKGQNSESNTPLSQSEANSDEESSKEASAPSQVNPGTDDNQGNKNNTNNSNDHCHGIKTVTSSSSVQEYFAQKMAELKRKRAGLCDSPMDNEQESPGSSTSPLHDDGQREDTELQQQKKKKKKKKKSSKESSECEQKDAQNECAGEVTVGSADGSSVGHGDLEVGLEMEKTMKRKKKDKKDREQSAEGAKSESDAGEAFVPLPDKDDTKSFSTTTNQPATTEEISTDSTEAPPKKKKKKKRRDSPELENNSVDAVNTDTVDLSASVPVVADCVSGESTQKTKKKKQKRADTEESSKTEMTGCVVKKSVRFSLGGDDLFLPGVEESVKMDISLSQSGSGEMDNTTSQTSKKRKRDKQDVSKDEPVAKKLSDSTDTEPISQHFISSTVEIETQSISSGGFVNDVESNAAVPNSSKPAARRKKKKSTGPVDVVGKCFQGSNLAQVKGYGNVHHY